VHQLNNKVFECHWCTVQAWRFTDPKYICPYFRTTLTKQVDSVILPVMHWTCINGK